LSIDEESRSVRISWHKKAVGEKAFVHDIGKFKSRPQRGHNCVVSLTFGAVREITYLRSGSQESLFFPQTNGALSAVGREVWSRWIAGVNTHPNQDGDSRGHISITVVGASSAMEEDKLLGPVASDAKLGDDSINGRLDVPLNDKARPEMRVITVPKRKRYGKPVSHDDVIIVPEFFCAEDEWETYYQLIKEMRESQAQGDRRAEWISWHEGAHLLSQNPTGSKTFQKIVDRMCDYFSVGEKNRGTRFNWYRDGSDWKPFHHDSAAFNPQRAANQNCTIGISFGAPRELAFRHAKTGELIYFPQKNGMLFYFGRDANIIWQHGINALPASEQDGKGRISIILWGLCTTAVDEPDSPPMLTDEGRDGKGKGKGKGKSKSKGEDDEEWRPDTPVDNPGEWVPTVEFTGHKSFGFYWCQCKKFWMSAHGYPGYTQDCKGCEEPSYPFFMWVNEQQITGFEFDKEKKVREIQGPHDELRCEACKAGVCDGARKRDY